MLMCLALVGLLGATSPSIPDLAQEVVSEAQALSAQREVNPAFIAALTDFSADAMAFSDALRPTGITQDLPCIFKGISEDAAVRLEEFQGADTEAERTAALAGLRVLLDDAILLAPMAVREVEGRPAAGDHGDAAAQSITPGFVATPAP